MDGRSDIGPPALRGLAQPHRGISATLPGQRDARRLFSDFHRVLDPRGRLGSGGRRGPENPLLVLRQHALHPPRHVDLPARLERHSGGPRHLRPRGPTDHRVSRCGRERRIRTGRSYRERHLARSAGIAPRPGVALRRQRFDDGPTVRMEHDDERDSTLGGGALCERPALGPTLALLDLHGRRSPYEPDAELVLLPPANHVPGRPAHPDDAEARPLAGAHVLRGERHCCGSGVQPNFQPVPVSANESGSSDGVFTNASAAQAFFTWSPNATADGVSSAVRSTVIASNESATVYLSYPRATAIYHDPVVGLAYVGQRFSAAPPGPPSTPGRSGTPIWIPILAGTAVIIGVGAYLVVRYSRRPPRL